MVMSSVVKEYLMSRDIPNYCRNEDEYRYHVELENTSRITGCEMVVRTVGAGVMLTAILPIKIRPKEARGLVRTLANYNAERTAAVAKQGFFELDYIENKIQFRLKVKNTLTSTELAEMIDFCLNELQESSDTMMRLVCEESELVWEQEQEEKRRQELASRPESSVKRAFKKLMGAIGLEEEEDKSAARLTAPVEEAVEQKTAIPEPIAQEKPAVSNFVKDILNETATEADAVEETAAAETTTEESVMLDENN